MTYLLDTPANPANPEQSTIYFICIKTDKYGGNFEREMAAFIFGNNSGCGQDYREYLEAGGHKVTTKTYSGQNYSNTYYTVEHGDVHPDVAWVQEGGYFGDGCMLNFVSDADHAPQEGYTCGLAGDANTICFMFDSRPTDEQIRGVHERAKLFTKDILGPILEPIVRRNRLEEAERFKDSAHYEGQVKMAKEMRCYEVDQLPNEILNTWLVEATTSYTPLLTV